MKIILSSILVGLFLSTSILQAQEIKEKRQEVTFLVKNFDDIGIGYRFGTSSGLWRISLTAGSKTTENIINDTTTRNFNNQSSIGVDLGREYRFKVADDLFLRIGGDVFYNRNLVKNESGPDARLKYIEESLNYGLGFKIVSGLMFQPTERIHLGFEFLPSFSWIKSERSSIASWDDGPLTDGNSTSLDTFNFNMSKSSLRFNFGFNF